MKKITMQDIANMAGVSKATVSLVLNNKDRNIGEYTRSRILKICDEMNYIPNSIARSLSTKRSDTIGILLPDITNPFFAEIFRAIEDIAHSLGYNVFLCNTDNNISKEEKYIELLISKLVDGVILVSSGTNESAIKPLENNQIPFVLVDRCLNKSEEYNKVYCCNKFGIYKAVNYLYSLGKKNIVFVTGSMDLEISIERLKVFEIVTKELGIYNKDNIFYGDFKLQGGMEVTEEIIKKIDNIDAIVYSNDFMAVGGMKVLTRNGFRVPEDINVIGYDNIPISEIVEPELSTISQPIYEIGKVACDLLIDVIDKKKDKPEVIELKPELVLRGTTDKK